MSNGRPFRRTKFIGPEIREDSSPDERERVVRRRLAATTGVCPCGARLRIPDDIEPGTLTLVAVEHEAGCPAIEEEMR